MLLYMISGQLSNASVMYSNICVLCCNAWSNWYRLLLLLIKLLLWFHLMLWSRSLNDRKGILLTKIPLHIPVYKYIQLGPILTRRNPEKVQNHGKTETESGKWLTFDSKSDDVCDGFSHRVWGAALVVSRVFQLNITDDQFLTKLVGRHRRSLVERPSKSSPDDSRCRTTQPTQHPFIIQSELVIALARRWQRE